MKTALPKIDSWRYLDMQLQYSRQIVDLRWTDESGARQKSVLRVDFDLNGEGTATLATFAVEAGTSPDEEILDDLEGDIAALDGSQFIPIEPTYYRRAV